MFRLLIYRIKKHFKGEYKYENRKYDDINYLYEKTYKKIKTANSLYKLHKVKKYIFKLDELTDTKYSNVRWIRNRNHTLKLLWLLKYNRVKGKQ